MLLGESSMAADGGGARRSSALAIKLRLREERKRVLRMLDAKYRSIEDHERGLLRFVLIRNNLRRLQREAREEKLARHRAASIKASNVSPSYLSSSARLRSPSPTDLFDSGLDDPPSPSKRPRLFMDEDKENEQHSVTPMDTTCSDSSHKDDGEASVFSSRPPIDDAQEILRDLYESCTSEALPPRISSPSSFTLSSPLSTTPSASSSSSTTSSMSTPRPDSPYTASYSLSMTSSCNLSSDNSSDWSRQQQFQSYPCGHSSLLGNDLHSVVFHSLIASLES